MDKDKTTIEAAAKEAVEARVVKIDALKKANPKGVFEISAQGKVAYLRTPTRSEISYASTFLPQDRLGYAETILENCWLEGDEDLKTEDKYFLMIAQQIDEIIQVEEVAIKKL